jgi:hypothetical protein
MKATSLVLAIALVAVVVLVGGISAFDYYRNVAMSSNHPSQCNDPDSISSHVYNPDRLTIVNSCIKASGTVENVFEEKDGDYHLRVALDSNYSSLVNDANRQYQYGDLVVEIICALPINQQDAVSACQGYTSNITVPSVGDHITVTGPYVLDTDHYDWAEIHPVYSLTID